MFKCGACCESYHPTTRVARILQCGHDFCEECLKSLHLNGVIICPDCQVAHRVKCLTKCPIAHRLMHHEGDAMTDQMSTVNEKILLGKYWSSVKDMRVPLAKVVDVFHSMVKTTQHAMKGLEREGEKVTSARNDGKKTSDGIDKMLLKLSAATTPEQIMEVLDQGDSQIEAVESTIHLAAKVRGVFTEGLKKMIRELLEFQHSYSAETQSLITNFKAQDYLTQKDGAQANKAQEKGTQGASKVDTPVKPVIVTVQSLLRGEGQVEELLTAGLVFAKYHHEGDTRYARITRQKNTLCVHHFQDQTLPAHAHSIPYSKLVNEDNPLVFLELEWPGSQPQRMLIRLQPDNPLATSFYRVVMGMHGRCYVNTRLGGMDDVNDPYERVYGGDLKDMGATLPAGLSILPDMSSPPTLCSWKQGIVAWGGWFESNDPMFIFTTKNNWGKVLPYSFGQVNNLGVLKQLARLGDEGVEKVTITDCGVVPLC